MDIEQRVLAVIEGVLVEFLILLILDGALAPLPERGGGVDLLDLVRHGLLRIAVGILVLIIVIGLVIFEVDRIRDVVRILLYQVLQRPAVGIFRSLIIEGEDDRRTLAIPFPFGDGVRALACRCPLPGLAIPGLPRDDRYLLRDHECRIESYAELADQVRIVLLLIREGGKELPRPR